MSDEVKNKDLNKLSYMKLIIPYAPIIDFFVITILFFTTTLFLKTNIKDAHILLMSELIVISAIYGSVWVLVAMTSGFYKFRRTRVFFENMVRIFKITFLSLIISMSLYTLLVGLIFHYYKFFHRRFFFLSLGLNFSCFSIYHYMVNKITLILQNLGYNRRKLLIGGTNEISSLLLKKINDNPFWGFTVEGFLHEDSSKKGEKFEDIEIIGTFNEIEKLFEKGNYDRLILCFSIDDNKKLFEIIKVCEKNNIDLQIVPGLYHFVTSKAEITNLDGMPVMGLHEPKMQGLGGVIKRIMDFTGSFFGLILLSPVFLLIAILVKLSSKGPVFYGQERMGLDNKPFYMWKFRSMKIDTDNENSPKMATKDDPRKTVIGNYLRKYSLDELPQLWNVLTGQMSLVGPRPERPFFVNQFKESIKDYMKRHRVKAGMTGWAQVNGLRGSETSLEKRIEFDLYYIENWSLFLDIEILLRTIGVVINDDSAL